MSLVLNGSGSITGLSAGGLPDGSVTADDIASLPAGSVIQVVSATASNSNISTTSTSFVSTGVNISITPTSATSKILVVFNTCTHLNTAENSGNPQEGYYTIYRGATNLGNASAGLVYLRLYGNGAVNNYSEYPTSLQVVDSPNTTSSVTYTTYFRSVSSSERVGYSYDTFVQTIYAMEIAA